MTPRANVPILHDSGSDGFHSLPQQVTFHLWAPVSSCMSIRPRAWHRKKILGWILKKENTMTEPHNQLIREVEGWKKYVTLLPESRRSLNNFEHSGRHLHHSQYTQVLWNDRASGPAHHIWLRNETSRRPATEVLRAYHQWQQVCCRWLVRSLQQWDAYRSMPWYIIVYKSLRFELKGDSMRKKYWYLCKSNSDGRVSLESVVDYPLEYLHWIYNDFKISGVFVL